MAHIHIHLLPDGTPTGETIVDPDNEDLHWHLVDGERTSTDPFGDGHTHTINGATTSGPIIPTIEGDNIHRDEDKGKNKMEMETKLVGGNVVQVNQVERNGIPVGIIKGHIATFDIDRGFDRFVPGAFKESLERHLQDNRQIRLKDHHGRTVGGFPINLVFEDEKGLFGTGEINLEVQQGREAFALAKQGVLSDFSIGFTSLEDQLVNGIRVIHKAEVWEGSIVDEPMNPEARITEVKSVIPFQDLAIASQDKEWDSTKALSHLEELIDGNTLHPKFKKAFLWCDGTHAEIKESYKLPVADIINGRLVVIPKGVFAATKAIQNNKVDIPNADRPEVIKNIEKYYAKMGLDSPFDGDQKQYFVSDDIKEWTERDIEKFLKSTGMMSRNAAKALADKFKTKSVIIDDLKEQNTMRELLEELKSFKVKLAE